MKRLLMVGQFAPGQALTIRSLADAMGTSVMPVREALQRLAVDQALIVMPNKSVRVPQLRRSDFDEIIEIRVRMEGLATEMAASSISDDDISQLEEIHAENTRAYEEADSALLLDSNQRFHFLLYDGARSVYLRPIIEGLWLRMGPLHKIAMKEWTKLKEPLGTARGKHVEVIEALKRRDPEAASSAMKEDIRIAGDLYVEHIEFVPESDSSS